MHSHSDKTLIYSAIGAVLFHVLLLFFYINFILIGPKTRNVVINNVDLLLQDKTARIPKPAGNKTLDFLKLALPKLPKIEIPVARLPTIDIKAPEKAPKKNFELPKLNERVGRVQAQERLDMDTAKRAATAMNANLDIKADHNAVALAPRIELEEVGMKKAPAMPENLKFDESAHSVTPQTMQELSIAVGRAKQGSAQPQGLTERKGEVESVLSSRIAPAMPERLAEAQGAPQEEDVTQGLRSKPVISVAGLSGLKGSSVKQAEEPKKVEIEGPLSKRRVRKFYVPDFPSWARDRGLLEASVSVKFYVDTTGRVLDATSIEKTSGYGALDRLAVDAIKQWQFESLAGAPSRQWGIITFRFVTD